MSLFPKSPQGRNLSGLYIRGRGNKSVFWYFEFDFHSQFAQQFETCDLRDAQKIHELDKLTYIWGEGTKSKTKSKLKPPAISNDGLGGVQHIFYFYMFVCVFFNVCLSILLFHFLYTG